jgi:hypothetical protein
LKKTDLPYATHIFFANKRQFIPMSSKLWGEGYKARFFIKGENFYQVKFFF